MKTNNTLFAYSLIFICLTQILYGFVYSDDLYTYHNPENYKNIYKYAQDTFTFWVNQGRLLFWMFAIQILFFFIYSVFLYKIYLIILNIIAFYCFTLILKKLIPKFSILLWTLFYLALFQFRTGYHCPYNSFFGMYPFLAIFSSLSIYYSLIYQDSKSKKHLIISLFCYLLGLMTIEIALMIPFISFLANYNTRKSNIANLKSHIPHILLTIIYISIIFYIKSLADFDMTYIGIKPSFEIKKIIKTAFIQISASFPLMNLYKQKGILQNIITQIKNHYVFLSVYSIIYFVIQTRTFHLINHIKNSNFYIPLFIGICLLLFPPFFISFSSKYQEELYFGRGYLPVYIQNFGLATILYSMYYFIRSEYLKKGLIFILFIIIFINLSYNFHLIEESTQKSYQLLKEMNP